MVGTIVLFQEIKFFWGEIRFTVDSDEPRMISKMSGPRKEVLTLVILSKMLRYEKCVQCECNYSYIGGTSNKYIVYFTLWLSFSVDVLLLAVFFCWQYVCDKLMEVYGIKCSSNNILNLDSSTEEKFSRHLIFNLQNAAFKDNIHVGMFQVVWRQQNLFSSICTFISYTLLFKFR